MIHPPKRTKLAQERRRAKREGQVGSRPKSGSNAKFERNKGSFAKYQVLTFGPKPGYMPKPKHRKKA